MVVVAAAASAGTTLQMSFRTVEEKWGLLGRGEKGGGWGFTKVGQHVKLHFSCLCNTNRRDKAFGDFKRFLFIVFVKL